jgi:hypothetical protein
MLALDDAAWRLLFLDARTHNSRLERAVDDAVLRRLCGLVRTGPTRGNGQPVPARCILTSTTPVYPAPPARGPTRGRDRGTQSLRVWKSGR